jgi:hypothetical protein
LPAVIQQTIPAADMMAAGRPLLSHAVSADPIGDIVRYVTAVTAFTCSKMRHDGFGGMAMLITA